MSVENFSRPDNGALEMLPHPPERCFYCGQSLAPIVVHWHGSDGAISLHPKCAETLSCRLIVDARHAELISIGKSIAAGINTDLLIEVAE